MKDLRLLELCMPVDNVYRYCDTQTFHTQTHAPDAHANNFRETFFVYLSKSA